MIQFFERFRRSASSTGTSAATERIFEAVTMIDCSPFLIGMNHFKPKIHQFDFIRRFKTVLGQNPSIFHFS